MTLPPRSDKGRFNRSLRFRLTIVVAGLFAIALVTAAAITRSHLRGQLERDARAAATALLDDYLSPSPSMVPSVAEGEVTRILYYGPDGEVIPSSTIGGLIADELQQFLPEGDITTGAFGPPGDGAIVLGSGFAVVDEMPIDGSEQPPETVFEAGAVIVELFTDPGPLRHVDVHGAVAVGRDVLLGSEPVTVVVAAPTASIDDSLDAITGVGVVAIPLLTLLVAAITWYVTARTLRPVEAIRRQVARTDPASLDHHVPRPGTGDEIDRLAGTMNDMLDRLHGASQQQRRLISDASHELRSPITATLATLETTTTDDIADRWPQLADTLIAEQHRLKALVDDLLLLAELDEHPAAAASSDSLVDLDELVVEEVARPRGVEVRAHIEVPQRVPGSERLLARALANVIDNASRHAAGAVDVTVTSDPRGRAIVRIDDDGPGIRPHDRARVLERFTRLDEPRHRTEGGAGLGLAIVAEIARQHHASLTISDSPSGGARFEIALPADLAASQPR